MKIKLLILTTFLLPNFAQGASSGGDKCKPPKKFSQYCNEIKQSASGGKENSGKFQVYKESRGKKHMDKIFRKNAPKAYQDVWNMCMEGVKDLDKACNENPSSNSCHLRNARMNEMNQVGMSFDDTINNVENLLDSGKDSYVTKKDLTKEFREELDPGNWKKCKDKEAQKKHNLEDPNKTIKGMQNKKDSPSTSKYKSKPPAKPNKENPTEQHSAWSKDLEAKRKYADKNDPKKIKMSSGLVLKDSSSSFVWSLRLQDLFLGKSFARLGKPTSLLKNTKQRFNERLRSGFGPKSRINEYGKNDIQTNRNTTGQSLINSLQAGIKQIEGMREHQARMSNDIQGEGMAATQERFEKEMEMAKKASDSLQKSLEALSFICKNQGAKTKCWGDSNEIPQLPFPFGGAGDGEDNSDVDGENYPFVARYFCPNKDENFSLKTKKGIWGSAIVVSPKGIMISHKKPLQGFEFHTEGCLVSIQDEDRPEGFQIYKSEPKFYVGDDGHEYDLMFFLPKNSHKEDEIIYGVEPDERDFEHLFDYLEEKQDECTPYKLDLGQFITAMGFPLSDNDLELERKLEKSEGFMTDSDEEEKKKRSFSIAAKFKHEGFSGGAIISDTDQCFAGIPFIRKISNSEYRQRMVPLPEVLKFIKDVLGVD